MSHPTLTTKPADRFPQDLLNDRGTRASGFAERLDRMLENGTHEDLSLGELACLAMYESFQAGPVTGVAKTPIACRVLSVDGNAAGANLFQCQCYSQSNFTACSFFNAGIGQWLPGTAVSTGPNGGTNYAVTDPRTGVIYFVEVR